jgi:hypothetical protein
LGEELVSGAGFWEGFLGFEHYAWPAGNSITRSITTFESHAETRGARRHRMHVSASAAPRLQVRSNVAINGILPPAGQPEALEPQKPAPETLPRNEFL